MSGTAKTAASAKAGWPWKPFVVFSLLSALAPGFLFGTFLALVPVVNIPLGGWYRAFIQAHGHAMVMGWGGSMVLGVALHFLPRLRGAKLAHPHVVPWAFRGVVLGTTLRVLGQPSLALAESSGSTLWSPVLHAGVMLGVFLQAFSVFGILFILARTFRAGPPAAKKQGFVQVFPALAVAGLALVLAQVVWLWSGLGQSATGERLMLFPDASNRAAIEMLLFGGVMAISLGMSARLFPLSFRIQHASRLLLWMSSGLLLIGVLFTAARAFGLRLEAGEAFAALAFAAGIVIGIPAVRVFHRRTPFPGKQRTYHLIRDPAGLGVVAAYGWAIVAAFFLLIFAWQELAGGVAVAKDLPLHAIGAGFMTLLILSVGWTMLPGFGGGNPRGLRWICTALALANVAVFFRVAPGALALLIGADATGAFYFHSFAVAGLAGLLAVGAFARALFLSWRPSEKVRQGGTVV